MFSFKDSGMAGFHLKEEKLPNYYNTNASSRLLLCKANRAGSKQDKEVGEKTSDPSFELHVLQLPTRTSVTLPGFAESRQRRTYIRLWNVATKDSVHVLY